MNTEPHEATQECAPTHCHWHEVDEPDEGAYLVCFECGHAYMTAADLRSAYEVQARELGITEPAPPADEIHFCQMCIHDF